MMDIAKTSYRFMWDVLRAFRATQNGSLPISPDPTYKSSYCSKLDELAAQALTTVFGMDAEGRINKEKARHVVEKLGLMGHDSEDSNGFEVQAEELALDGLDEDGLRDAFTVFDEDGNGFIEALEVKRVLECLGLANNGWGLEEFEEMVRVVDLNFDGKVDFTEFELMMVGHGKIM